jgi:hypothetical protein
MALSQIPNRGSDPVALADVTLEALLTPSCKAEKGALQVARDERKEEPDHDPLGSARGIANGLRLSITLWSFIVLIILLMW